MSQPQPKETVDVGGGTRHQMVDVPPNQVQHNPPRPTGHDRHKMQMKFQRRQHLNQQRQLPFRTYIEPEGVAVPPYQMDLNMENGEMRPATSVIKAAPFGLCAFSLTSFCLGLYNVRAVDSVPANFMTGTALFMGGTGQVIAGILEFTHGNTFGATTFLAFGLYWLSYATILVPTFGVAAAYANYQEEYETALGTYYLAWTIFTFLMWTLTLRSNWSTTIVFFFLGLSYLFAAITMLGHMAFGSVIQKLSGATGLVASASACYGAMSDLSNKDNSYYTLPIGELGHHEEDHDEIHYSGQA